MFSNQPVYYEKRDGAGKHAGTDPGGTRNNANPVGRKNAFVNDILERMPEPKPAYNTVSTIVRILEKKGAVGHEVLGKSHRYYPLFGREAYTQNLMQGVVRNFFGNSFARMVSFFCEKEHLPADESEKILQIAQEAIARTKKRTE